MKIYKGRVKYFFIILGIIAALFLVFVFENPVSSYVSKVVGLNLYDEEVDTDLADIYFEGYEGINIANPLLYTNLDVYPDTEDDNTYNPATRTYTYTMYMFADDEEFQLFTTKKSDDQVVSVTYNPSGLTSPKASCISTGCQATVTSTIGSQTTTYSILMIANMTLEDDRIKEDFSGSGASIEWVVPRSGTYKLEAWGARGGNGKGISNGVTYVGGYGAYTSGEINLVGGTKLYIYLGEHGQDAKTTGASTVWSGGWNGGGYGVRGTSYASGSGGGATDFRTIKTNSNSSNLTESLASRIMVAAGGAGGAYSETSSSWSTQGGGLYVEGLSSNNCYANQSGGFEFGRGYTYEQADAKPLANGLVIGGAGGGWFGGNGSINELDKGAGCGGSSYISGHLGSIGVYSDGSSKLPGAQTGETYSQSYSNTGYVFKKTTMVDGYGHEWTTEPVDTTQAPLYGQTSPSTGYASIGNMSSGYARVTQIAKYAKIDNVLKTLTASRGTFDTPLTEGDFDYVLTLDTFDNNVTITGTVNDTTTTEVSEPYTLNIEVGRTENVVIFVTDIASGLTNSYTITVIRPELPAGAHSTYIQKIDNPNNPTIYIDNGLYTYDLPIRYGKVFVDLTVYLYDNDATYTITGADFLENDTGVITIKVTDPNASPSETTYTFNYNRENTAGDVEDEYHFYYSGAPQEFEIPVSGDYRFEAWGGAGGTMNCGWSGIGGKGAYTSGEVNMAQGTKLYIYVGGKGANYCDGGTKAGGWNGGGKQLSGASAGGGASDIRLVGGSWDNGTSLNSRIMVAGAGGGSNDSTNGGYGGTLVGGTASGGSASNGSGGTQTSGGVGLTSSGGSFGLFGKGGNSYESYSHDGGAGGSGYYGGAKGAGYNVAGGGGSSYVSGYQGCVAVISQNSSQPRRDKDDIKCTSDSALEDVVCSYHYSNYIFKDAKMIAGNSTQPTYDGESVQNGNEGTGHVKITPLSTKSENNFLSDLTFDGDGTRDPVQFKPNVYNYEITVGMYTQFINLEGIPYDSKAIVTGDGKKLLEVGTNDYDIVVTAENGSTRVYHVTVIREDLKGQHSNAINNIYIEDYGYLYIEKNVYNYNFRLNYNKYDAVMTIKCYDPDAKYTVEGADLIVANSGTITINVYHEDGSPAPLTYKLNYTRQIPTYDIESPYIYECTKGQEQFVAPLDGYYLLEAWGAQGGGYVSEYTSPSHGGRGGYSKGTIYLAQNEKIYIRVGCAGSYAGGLNQGAGWNGGGSGGGGGYGGGGATDFRYKGDVLSRRIMVAGGGGGADNGGGSYHGGDDGSGGVGGGTEGENAYINGVQQPNTGGTQTTGYQLGVGQSVTTNTDTGGAGGGYWGGKVTNNNNGGGGGGSGYIDTELFEDGVTYPGSTSFPSVTEGAYEQGHPGDGIAKITVMSYLSENNYLESITSDIGTWDKTFTPATKEYTVTIGTYENYITFVANAYDAYAEVIGDKKYEMDIGENTVNISVTAQNGNVRTYTITVIRTPISTGIATAELQKIKFEGLPDVLCEKDVYEYEIMIPDTWYYLTVTPIAYDVRSSQRLKGFSYIPETQTATITSRVVGGQTLTYTIKIKKGNAETLFKYDFYYTGSYQTFTAPVKGYYTFQVWGAQGGDRGSGRGGHGGYATGRLLMDKNQTVYIYVGGSGNTGGTAGGWNGGGSREGYAGGGGASDVRTEIDDLYTRFIVAGGGGSVGYYWSYGGVGGGLTGGYPSWGYGWGGAPGTQTYGGGGSHSANTGTFGQGGTGYYKYSGYAGAGGGGWYGGGGSHPDGSADDDRGGGGGSGFVLTADTRGNAPLGYKLGEEYYLKDTSLIPGSESMPNPDSNGNMTGRAGNGFVRVRLTVLSDNNFLSKLTVKYGDETLSYSPNFNLQVQDYTVNLETDQTSATIEPRPDDSTATITGYGTFEIPPGQTTKVLTVTSESGKDREYRVKFNREASTSSEPIDIRIVGLADNYCGKDPLYCKLSPKTTFDPNVHDYTMTIPYQISQLDFQVDKTNANQVVGGAGKVTMNDVTTNVSIVIQSEACALANDTTTEGCVSVYNYSITRDMAGDADLKYLRIVNPSNTSLLFDRDVIEYTLSVPYEYTSLGLEYETDYKDATAVVTGNENFELGWNRVLIEVTAVDNTKKRYGLSVYREKDDSTLLSDIMVTSGEGEGLVRYSSTPSFDRLNTGIYAYIIPNNITELDITGIKESANATIAYKPLYGSPLTVDSATGHISNIYVGYSYVGVEVTAMDGTKDTYKLRIYRERNGDSTLGQLIVKAGTTQLDLKHGDLVGYDPTVYEYEVMAPMGTEYLDITAPANVNTSSVSIYNPRLQPGKYTRIFVFVTAENGTRTTYIINAFRPASSINTLSSLHLLKYNETTEEYDTDVEYTPTFDGTVNEYEASVPNEVRNIKIVGSIADQYATIQNNRGIYALAVGVNKINFKVISEAGAENIYVITITRAPSSNAYLSSVTINDNGGRVIVTSDHNVLTYDINVSADVENLEFLEVIPESDETTWELIQEQNPLDAFTTKIFKIRTLAGDGNTSKVYTFNVLRDKSNQTNLEWLLLHEGSLSPAFDPYVLRYDAWVPYDATSGVLDVVKEDSRATYAVNTNVLNNFVVGENTLTVKVTAEDGESQKVYTIIVHRQEKEASNNKLFRLAVDQGTLTPAFDKDVPYYEVTLPYEITDITVSADPIDTSDAVVQGTGKYKLQVGRNLIVVKVFSSDEKVRDYQILVTRKASTEARLKALVLEGALLDKTFDPDTYYYEVTTQDSYLTFREITPMHPDATYKIKNNLFYNPSGTYDVEIVVTAPDKIHTKTYTIRVNKTPSMNAYLSFLEVEGYTLNPSFSRSTSVYEVIVPEGVLSVNVIAAPESLEATVEGTGVIMLGTGITMIPITVTSGTGNQFTYTIVVRREVSSNALLEMLRVNNGIMKQTADPNADPVFDPSVFEYNVSIPNEETELDVFYKPQVDTSTVDISDKTLENVTTKDVVIKVIAENGEMRTYVLHVTKQPIISALLSELEFQDYLLDPLFDSNVFDYYLYQNNEDTSVVIKRITALDTNATISYDASKLTGMTVDNQVYDIPITVTASDGSDTKVYTVHVLHQEYVDNFLTYVNYCTEFYNDGSCKDYKNLTPTFDKETMSYTISLPNETDGIKLNVEHKSDISIELVAASGGAHYMTSGYTNFRFDTGTSKIGIIAEKNGIKRTYVIDVTRAKNSDNTIHEISLRYDGKDYASKLVPEFDPYTNDYTLTVDVGTAYLDISAKIANSSTIMGDGKNGISLGTTTLTLSVTSEAGVLRTYTIVVTRDPSSDCELTDLIPSSGTLEPEFTMGEYTYTLYINSGVGTLSFDATTADGTANILGISSQIVPDGDSTRTITVVAEDNTSKVYTVNVHKYSTDNANLKSLQIGSYTLVPEFDKNITEYTVMVPNSMKVVRYSDVSAVPEDGSASVSKTYSINTSTIDYTDFAILVTASDNVTKKTYHLKIKRELGSSTTLDSLSTNTGYLKPTPFVPTKYEYTYMIPTTQTSVSIDDFKYVATDDRATVTYDQAIDLTDSNIDLTDPDNPVTFTIRVTAEDLSGYSEYVITLKWDFNSVNTLKSLYVENGYMVQTFKPGLYRYDIYEYYDQVSDVVHAEAMSEKATITSGTGAVDLTQASEFYHYVNVEAEDGQVLQYTLHFIVSFHTDTNLLNFALEGTTAVDLDETEGFLVPTFDGDIVEYEVHVPYDYPILDWTYQLMNEEQTAEFLIDGNPVKDREYRLPIGQTDLIINVYDGLKKLTQTYTIHIVKNQSDNALLKKLTVAHMDNHRNLYTLNPAFASEIYEYTVEVGRGEKDVPMEVYISAETAEPNADTRTTGYNMIWEGENDAKVIVTAQDGTIKTYVIHIIREPEFNSWLKDLTVSAEGVFHQITPNFRKTVKNYTLKLPGNVDKVTIDATPDVSTTIVRGTGTYDIGLGMTVISLTSTATNGDSSVYQIGIIQDASNDVDLRSLVVEGYPSISPEFDRSIIHYTLDVDADCTSLNVTAIANDPKASVFVLGNNNLMTGSNTVSVQVLSQSKIYSKTYQIEVNKPMSRNAALTDVKVYDYFENIEEDHGATVKTYHTLTPKFDSKTYEYDVTVPYNVETIFFEYTKANPMSRIKGAGSHALNYGENEITITVTAEDGETTEDYTFNIYREYDLFLEKIELNNGIGVIPAFEKTTHDYEITVPNNVRNVYVRGTPEDPEHVIVSGNSTYPSVSTYLSTTQPTVATLTLTADDGKTATYRVRIIRESNSNPNAEMISLSEGSLDPEFNKDTTSYVTHVHPTALNSHVTFTVTPEVDTTNYQIIGNTNLQGGTTGNNVIVRMTAEDGTTIKDYNIKVIVEDEEYFSNRLTGLSLVYPEDEDYNIQLIPAFDSSKNTYSASVANSVDHVRVDYTGDVNTSVTGDKGLQNISYGRNVLTLKVTNTEDANIPENIYTIVVYRLDDNANLAELVIKGYPIIFAQNVEEYSINVADDVESLEITAVPVDPNSTVDIIGNENFGIGLNDITITVTSPAGNKRTYTVHTRRASSGNPYLSSLEVVGYEYQPTFDAYSDSVYRLTVKSDVESVMIKGTPEKNGTTCTNLGATNLEFGANDITIVCTASDGTTTHEYKLNITREASAENRLATLVTSPQNIKETFAENITDYTVKLGQNDGQNIRINATAKDVDSTITGLGEYYLNEQFTTIPITVTAPDGSKMIYNITVEIYIDTSPTLAELWVEEGQITPAFNPNTQVYSLHVPYEVTEATVKYKTSNDTSIAHVEGNTNLEVKTNEVTVTVVNGNETYEYTIYVIRDPYASNKLKKLTVKDKDTGTTYPLTPAFTGDRLYYTVTVPNNVSKATVSATPEDTTSVMQGNKVYNLNVGANVAYVLVTSASNYTRSYTVVITRQSEEQTSNLSYLTSLTEDCDDADFTPAFDSTVTSYDLVVPSDTDTITINGTAAPGATVKGFGKSILKYGMNQRSITVTGSDNSKTVYYVHINRPFTDHTAVTSITPSVGTLNYVDGETEYDMAVEATTASIKFTVVTGDPMATVTVNNENQDTAVPLVSGKNIVTIKVTGTNGEVKEIHIFVNKSTAVTDIELDEEEIILGVGEYTSVGYEFTPVDTAYTGVTWSIDTTDFAEVAVNGLITGKSPGTATVTITSDFDSTVKDTLKVKVIYKDIRVKETSGYEVGKKDTNLGRPSNYIYKVTAGVSIKDFMKEIKNDAEYLHIYDITSAELSKNSEDIIKTGMSVKLIVGDYTLDECIICVRGDSSGDGYVTAVDSAQIKSTIDNANSTNWYQQVAMDMNYDNFITAVDTAQIKLII